MCNYYKSLLVQDWLLWSARRYLVLDVYRVAGHPVYGDDSLLVAFNGQLGQLGQGVPEAAFRQYAQR